MNAGLFMCLSCHTLKRVLISSNAADVTLSEMESLDGANTPAKQQHDASLADQPDKPTHCSDAGDSHSGRQLPDDQNTPGSLLGTPAAAPTPRRDVKPDTRKRVAFIAVGKT